MADFGPRYIKEYNVLSNLVFADCYSEIIQGTFTDTLTASQKYQFYLGNSSKDLNDEIHYPIFAKAGSRTLQIMGKRSSDNGILSVYLDDALKGTIDLYRSMTLYNSFSPLALTLSVTKMYTLKLKVTDKNASSSNYAFFITWIRIV